MTADRVAQLHDLMVELGRVELLLDRNRKTSTQNTDALRSRQSRLQQALTRFTV